MEQLTTIGSITLICYLVGVFIKSKTKVTNDLIPVICGTVGAIINTAYQLLTVGANESLLVHIGYGVIAGISATGIKEITKIKEILNNGKNK